MQQTGAQGWEVLPQEACVELPAVGGDLVYKGCPVRYSTRSVSGKGGGECQPVEQSPLYDVRHGTTSLFAALDVAAGKVIAQCHRQHRHQEFLRFLNKIESGVPAGMDIHLVLDKYATHKTPRVER